MKKILLAISIVKHTQCNFQTNTCSLREGKFSIYSHFQNIFIFVTSYKVLVYSLFVQKDKTIGNIIEYVRIHIFYWKKGHRIEHLNMSIWTLNINDLKTVLNMRNKHSLYYELAYLKFWEKCSVRLQIWVHYIQVGYHLGYNTITILSFALSINYFIN